MDTDTDQHSLELGDRLISDRSAVDLPDLVADVQRRLSVYHAAVHDPGDYATTVVGELQRNALKR